MGLSFTVQSMRLTNDKFVLYALKLFKCFKIPLHVYEMPLKLTVLFCEFTFSVKNPYVVYVS